MAHDGDDAERAKKRILIVDDEETLLAALGRYFRRLGCAVVTATEREEAEALLMHEGFDLVILDLALTGYGAEGLEILREIRYASAGTPVVILSALVDPQIRSEALRRGADVVLSKPQPLSELAKVAARLMGMA